LQAKKECVILSNYRRQFIGNFHV